MKRLVRPVLGCLAVAASVVLLVRLPRSGGTTWTAILAVLRGVGPGSLALLAGVWLVGTLAYTLVQVAALPGLGRRRALTLNLASSAVASAVPGGGPLSLAANWAMLRSWGFTAAAFSTYALVTTLTVAAAKLALPLLAGAAVLVEGDALPAGLHRTVIVAVVALGVLGAAVAVLASFAHRPGPNGPNGRGVPGGRVGRLLRRADHAVRGLALRSGGIVRENWRPLLTGATLQLGLQYALFALCLAVTGPRPGAVTALLGFAVGRALSAVPVTPGGLGVMETGSAAVLVALGADPTSAVAGVVLFSMFVVLLEVPAGAACLLWWRLRSRAAGALPRTA